MNKRKIIVLTPVKNEDWILERFLTVCSIFADYIVIADQNSTDRSLEIYSNFPKAVIIQNKSETFNEAERQLLLLNTARNMFGLGNILLALDADEILAANAMDSEDWQTMLNAEPGTILYFEKPTLLGDTYTSIRYNGGGWPLGYVDDGAEHTPRSIHSTRVPTPEHAKKLVLNEIKFLHYALVRLDAQSSKLRMYSMLENTKGTMGLRQRIKHYNSQSDYSNEGDFHEMSNSLWFEWWERKGIDMRTIPKSEYYWQDYAALKLFKQFGTMRFAFDDIWNFDWEKCRLYAKRNGIMGVSNKPIHRPFPLFSDFVKNQVRILQKAVSIVKNNGLKF